MTQRLEKYEFKYTDNEGKETSLTLTKEMFTWNELIREFHYYLKGQGYIFDNDKIFDLIEGEYDYE